ncbi:MAG: restriction endonuclease subunit S [Alphaproteobacteria bacterium]|nr:restriction endonuclease subunit S [Alphaproteobacteria bacterium]
MKNIDYSDWKEFIIDDIFKDKIHNSSPYHKGDVKETSASDGLNYIVRSKFNNGFNCKVVRNNTYNVNPAGTISFGAENANFFYQEEEYITGNKMYYIDTSNLSKNACLFLKAVLERTFTKNFSFSDGMIPSRIKSEKILLPAILKKNDHKTNEQPTYEPDWERMDNYIKEIKERVLSTLDILQ